jgi:hypothetical protein
MYLASMHFGFPFTNFAFTSTCVKLFITRKSELNRVCLLEKSGGSERETERETKMETSRTRDDDASNGEAMTSDVVRYETHRAMR